MESSDTDYEFREEAVPFVVYNQQTSGFEISDDAREMFKHLRGPFGIVSVAGMYRTGKSYLLNKVLLNRKTGENGFGVGPSINPCTKGLWVWGTPIKGYSPDGKPINVLIIDSEGIGATDEDSNHDTRIFSLCILLSSFFLYNSMGSIDESALQNLNLVINLTKHIQVKSSSHDDADSEEYSEHFPSFMWIVRDFTLQLVDDDGEPINPNKYLEKALQEQKGFSEKIEEKNRIRRLLKSFFADRQCFTMIRPVTDEEALQNLGTMDENNFRVDFLEQVMQLRKKVTHCVKPKMMNGRNLTPDMFLTLADNYVTAINQGVVPNIENAWTYICQNESKKSLDSALQMCNDRVGEIMHKTPMEEHELRQDFEEIRADCKEFFVKSSVGGVIVEHLEELKYQIQSKLDNLLAENERECQIGCGEWLDFYYADIDKKLKNNEYETFYRYEDDIKEFKDSFYREAPLGPSRNESLLSFLNERLSESIDIFIKRLSDEIEYNTQLTKEQILSLERQIDDLKVQKRQDQEASDQNIKKLQIEKSQNAARIASLEDSLKTEQERFSKNESEFREKYRREKDDTERKLEILKGKLEDTKRNEHEKSQELMKVRSEYDKEMSLLKQRNEHLEGTLEEIKQRQDEIRRVADQEREKLTATYRGQKAELENQILELKAENETVTERLQDFEERCLELEQELNDKTLQLEESLNESRDTDFTSTEEFQKLQQKFTDYKAEKDEERDMIVSDFNQKIEEVSITLKDAEESIKKLNMALTNEKNRYEKDLAIYIQKCDFSTDQIQQLKQQLEEKNKENESLVEMVGNGEKESEEFNELQIRFMEYKHASESEKDLKDKEISDLKNAYDRKVTEMNDEVYSLTKNLEMSKSEYESMIEDLNDQIDALMQEKDSQPLGSETARNQLLDEAHVKYKEMIDKLDLTIDEMKAKHAAELEEIKARSSANLQVLKETYDEERTKLEQRIKDCKRKFAAEREELVDQHERELDERDEERDNHCRQLEDDLIRIQREADTENHDLKQRNERLQQQLISVQSQLKEKSSLKQSIEEKLAPINAEKRELSEKNDKLGNELMMKQMEIEKLKNSEGKLCDEMKHKITEAEKEKLKLESDKEKLENENKEISDKLFKLESEKSQERNDLLQTIALLRQQEEFNREKIDELNLKIQTEGQDAREQAMKQFETEKSELENTIRKLTDAKERTEAKLEEKKSKCKELENTLGQKNAYLDKDNAILTEKVSNLQRQLDEERENYEAKLRNIEAKAGSQSGDIQKERDELLNENLQLKKLNEELESEHFETKTALDKSNALLESENKYLKEQIDGYKLQEKDSTRRFELTLLQLSKKKDSEKEKISNGSSTIIETIEDKNRNKINDLNEKHNRITNDLQSQLDAVKRESLNYKERLITEQNEKRNTMKKLEKEIQNLKEKESILTSEINELKTQNDDKYSKYHNELRTDKESYLEKMRRDDEKLKEETSKNLRLEHELSVMVTKYESSLREQSDENSELKEKVDSLSKKIKTMTKENERLKKDKTYRKGAYGAERSSSNFGKGGLRPSYSKFPNAAGMGQSSANSSVSGSQKENSSLQSRHFGSKYINESLGKTTNFDDLSTNKGKGIPLGRNGNQNSSGQLLQYESRDEDE